MIRNALITGMFSVLMGLFTIVYTSETPPQDRPVMQRTAGETNDTNDLSPDSLPAQQGLMIFRQRIRPLLVRTCLKCHDSAKRSGGLDLTRRATTLAGGDSGEAIVPGKPTESLLYQLVTAGEMPREANPLPPQQIAAIKQWIELGALYEGEPLANETGPAAMTAAVNTRGAATTDDMMMCPCMKMMMRGMTGQNMMGGQTRLPAATAKPFSNPRTKEQARQQAEDHLKSLGNPHLTVGKINETIASFEIQVVPPDGSLVNWIIIDKKNGQLKTLY